MGTHAEEALHAKTMNATAAMEIFRTSRNRILRIAALSNSGISTDLLMDAVHDEDPVVCAHVLLLMLKRGWKSSAISNFLPELLDRALQDGEARYLRAILADILTEPEDLHALYKTNDWGALLGLANNKNCPRAILDALANLKEERSEKLKDRFDVIRSVAIARGGMAKEKNTESAK